MWREPDVALFAPRLLESALADVALSSVVAIVVWLLCRMLGGRWPAFQQALWVLVLLRLVLPPGLAHPLAAGALLERAGVRVAALWGDAAHPPEAHDSTAGVPSASDAIDRRGVPRASTGAARVLAVWTAIVIGMIVRDSRRARACRRVAATASVVGGGATAARLAERWRRRLGIRRAVRVVAGEARMSPFTIGLLHPIVFLPSALLARGNRDALAAALGHELAHVARWDVLWMRLERWLGRVYFFHPAVWMASRHLHAGRERLCDAVPVSHGLMSAPRYVEGLLGMLQLDLQGVEAPSLTLSQRRILMRFQHVLAVRPARSSRPILAVLIAAFIGCFLLPLAGADGPPAAQTASAATARSSPTSLANPLPSGHVTRPYGKGVNPFGSGVEFHKGIDVAAESGTPIVAPAAAIVELATTTYAPQVSAGTVVILDHQDGRKTFYSHLGELKVKTGQHVARGTTLGLVGNTGRSTGPHVHFELWQNGAQVDPTTAVPDWARTSR